VSYHQVHYHWFRRFCTCRRHSIGLYSICGLVLYRQCVCESIISGWRHTSLPSISIGSAIFEHHVGHSIGLSSVPPFLRMTAPFNRPIQHVWASAVSIMCEWINQSYLDYVTRVCRACRSVQSFLHNSRLHLYWSPSPPAHGSCQCMNYGPVDIHSLINVWLMFGCMNRGLVVTVMLHRHEPWTDGLKYRHTTRPEPWTGGIQLARGDPRCRRAHAVHAHACKYRHATRPRTVDLRYSIGTCVLTGAGLAWVQSRHINHY